MKREEIENILKQNDPASCLSKTGDLGATISIAETAVVMSRHT